MKLHTGWWKARDGSKWHVDWAGNAMAVGHDDTEVCRVWRLNGIMTTGNFDKDLISPWAEPKEGSVEWANSLPVGTKVRWRTWLSGRYVTRTKCGWTRPQIKGVSLAVPGELLGEREPGWRLYTEPKLRPWEPEEVPLGAWMRHKQSLRRYLIISDGLEEGHADWLSNYEHSIDGGKTWLPCGVEEAK